MSQLFTYTQRCLVSLGDAMHMESALTLDEDEYHAVPLAFPSRLTLGPGENQHITLWQVELTEAKVCLPKGAFHPRIDPCSWQTRAAQHEDAFRSQARAKCGRPGMASFQPSQARPVARASAHAARAMICEVAPDHAAGAPRPIAQGENTCTALPGRHMASFAPRARARICQPPSPD